MYRIGIIGSGPAAFYTAQKLIKSSPNIKIDMFEKLPVPFGLIRYGVAPDHPEVKNVIKTFTQVARHENFRYFGNVNIGHDILIKDMKKLYHSIVLAYGASQDKKIGVSGEDLKGVYAAIDLVGWYNGLPEKESFEPDLSGEEVILIGHGNVGLDIARILLSPIKHLKATDIPERVIAQLSASKIRTIHLVGRRGPAQVAFTIKEFRELLGLPEVRGRILIPPSAVDDLSPDRIDVMSRPRKRLTNLIVDSARKQRESINPDIHGKEWQMHFLLSPRAILEHANSIGQVGSVQFAVNTLQGDNITETGETVEVPCQMVVRSIGYRSMQIDPDIPFDSRRNIVPNINGHVIESRCTGQSQLYCVGWIKRGPVGVIINTLTDAQDTCDTMLRHISETIPRVITDDVVELLSSRGIKYLSFANWEALDQIERSLGVVLGKPREKLTNIHDMMLAATRPCKPDI